MSQFQATHKLNANENSLNVMIENTNSFFFCTIEMTTTKYYFVRISQNIWRKNDLWKMFTRLDVANYVVCVQMIYSICIAFCFYLKKKWNMTKNMAGQRRMFHSRFFSSCHYYFYGCHKCHLIIMNALHIIYTLSPWYHLVCIKNVSSYLF